MLLTLSVQNYALIDQLDIQFSNQFSTITGETGAGKSIILGALGLILGNRADLTSLKDKEKKCVVEASFEIENYQLQDFFNQNNLDFDATTIIRREILPTGKSRAFINDSPTNLAELQLLAEKLIDIHSQNQTKDLENESYQLEILDALASNHTLLIEYKTGFANYKIKYKALQDLLNKNVENNKEHDYNLFLFNELEQAKLQANEQPILEEEYQQLNNVETISEALSKLLQISEADNIGLLTLFNEAKSSTQKIANLATNYKELNDRLSSVIIEFNDIKNTTENLLEQISFNPEKLAEINNRLQLIYTLQTKHQVNSVEELLEIQNQLSDLLLASENNEVLVKTLENEIAVLKNNLTQVAVKISNNRQKAIPVFIQKSAIILHQLGMPNAQFNINLKQATSFLPNGTNELELLFSANKGTDFGLLKKVASGGEMSRIMLTVKAILAEYQNMPTILFDEIDTGVSGEIALNMAEIMKKMSIKRQVFSITHLPQIAAKGNQQYKVLKEIVNNTTVSNIKLLNPTERIQEIAEMLSGKNPTETALTHAKTLLN